MAHPRSDLDDLHRLADELTEEPARAALRLLLDTLPEDQLEQARRILEAAAGHGPLTENEIAARDRLRSDPTWHEDIAEGIAAYGRGDVIDIETALAELGEA